MLRSITLTVPPTAPVVTVSEAKAHLRVSGDDEDLLIQGMIDAAVGYLDGLAGVLGRALAPQTYVAIFDAADSYRLPIGPVVTSEAVEADGVATVTFIAGYPGGVPEQIRKAILLHVANLYEHRETGGGGRTPSGAYEALLAPYRVWI